MHLLEPPKTVNEPWNKGKLVGQKCPLKRRDIWALRVRLEMTPNHDRDLAMFNLAIDSKLRASDLVKLRVKDVSIGGKLLKRTMIIQQKTSLPVQFELTEPTRDVLDEYIHSLNLRFNDYLFESRNKKGFPITTRQYSRIVKKWVSMLGLDECYYATHSLRRTKVSIIYKQTKNLRAIQLLLGHKSLQSTVQYLGVEVEDALELAEQTEI